jgi:hypothetical protein
MVLFIFRGGLQILKYFLKIQNGSQGHWLNFCLKVYGLRLLVLRNGSSTHFRHGFCSQEQECVQQQQRHRLSGSEECE